MTPRITRLFLITAIAAIVARPTIAQPHSQPAPFDHSPFDRILKKHVHDERVDYRAIRRDHRGELVAYLGTLAQLDPGPLARDEQLALYINLYNATMILAVIDRYRPGYTPSEKNFSVFGEPLVRVGGRVVSLNDLEHKIIRPTFKDPRIHAALVCAARSCPPLLPRAYRGDDLDGVLDANMRRFVTDHSRNQVDRRGKKLRLSPIFQWYADDFGGEANLAAYVDRYHPDEVSGFSVSFLDYSWELNDTAGEP